METLILDREHGNDPGSDVPSIWVSVRELAIGASLTIRQRAWWLVGGGVVMLVMARGMRAWDHAAGEWLHAVNSGAWIGLARGLSWWGELHRAPMMLLVALGFAGVRIRKPALVHAALAGVLASVSAGLLANIIKWVVSRPRPSTSIPDGFYWFKMSWEFQGFPSGHAAHCVAIVGAVSVVTPRFGWLLGVGALSVAWSRFWLERHYVSDLWAGAVLGIVCGVVFGMAARRLAGWSRHVWNGDGRYTSRGSLGL